MKEIKCIWEENLIRCGFSIFILGSRIWSEKILLTIVFDKNKRKVTVTDLKGLKVKCEQKLKNGK